MQPLRVPPAEFMSKTALRVSRRTANLQKVDEAYATYFAHQTDKLLAGRLLDALEAYKKEIGGDWSKSERNTKSGGLFHFTEARLLQEAKRNKWWKFGDGDPGANALANRDIPHSRYGVLYLLGQTEFDTDTVGVVLDGVAAVGGAIGVGVSTNFNHLDSAKLGTQTDSIFGTDVSRADSIGMGGLAVSKGGGAINSLVGSLTAPKGSPKILSKEVGGTPRKKVDIALWPVTLAMLDDIAEDPALFLNPLMLFPTLAVGVTVAVVEALNALRTLLMKAVYELFYFVKDKLLQDQAFAWDVSGVLVKKMVKFIVGKCLVAAAPLIGSAMDIGGGLLKTISAAREKVGAWLLRRKIQLQDGHPALLAASIEGEMSKGIFQGLWVLLKGVATLAIQSFLPGAGNLVNAIVTGIEWMIKMLWRVWESSKIKKFLLLAKVEYEKERKLAEITKSAGVITDPKTNKKTRIEWDEVQPCLDKTKGGIITDVERFKRFYQKGCDASPLIPIITLNSGVCGSLMTMLKMFEGREQKLLANKEYMAAGTEYFTRLKEFGRNYIDKAGFKMTSKDPSVMRYLLHAKTNHTRPKSLGDKLLRFGSA